MTAKRSVQLSRRDALKLLGAAAGASVLANLPSKWSTPQSVAGVLPAHAQTSCTRIFEARLVELDGPPVVILHVAPTYDPSTLFPPVPDAFEVKPPIGYEFKWECTSGCLQVLFNGVWDFLFPGGEPGLSITDGTVYVNLTTGQYGRSWVVEDLPPGCPWDIIL